MNTPQNNQQLADFEGQEAPDRLDQLLSNFYHQEGQFHDERFSDDRLSSDRFCNELVAKVASLPPKKSNNDLRLIRFAHWASITSAAILVSAIFVLSGGQLEGPGNLATLVLVGLLAFWSWPRILYHD
jgi:hypothetical protein